MRLHRLLLVGLALSVTGCGEKQEAVPEPEEAAQMTAPVTPVARNESWQNDTFLQHMHNHAEKLDDLNFALADDDLEAAMTPAYWLARHETVSDVQPEWQPFLDGMRAEARAVEEASDLEAARAAAERITIQCQGCHAAVGVAIEQR